jgi:ribose transport system substrate-binding protein
MKRQFLMILAIVMVVGLFSAGFASEEIKNVAVLIKATNSDFWQYVLVGAENYTHEFPEKVSVKTYGPPSEADIEEQITILEQIITSEPDAIVIASTSSDAAVPAIKEAREKGIVVIAIDNKVNTEVDSFLATNNIAGGEAAAEEFVRWLQKYDKKLEGSVGLIGNMSGSQTLLDREEGFTNKLKELAPNIKVLEVVYSEGDITKAMDAATNIIEANDDLIGFFASSNTSGNGVSRVVTEKELIGKLVVIAFDSDPEEIKGLETGSIHALIVQDPYGMGYKGTDYALQKISGQEIPEEVDTGVAVVTKENMNNEDIVGILNPMTKKVK